MATELTNLTQAFTKSRPVQLLQEYSIRHNPDMVRARSALGEFAAQHFDFDGHRDDFTLIKKFTAPGTGIDVLEDKSVQGKILVEKIHPKHEAPLSYLYYISAHRRGKLGEPIIYSLNASELIRRTDYRLPVYANSQQNKLWSFMLERALRDPKLVTHQLIEMNKEGYENVGFFDSIFHVQSNPAFDQSVEVWQKGHAEKMRHSSHSPRIFLETISPHT